MANDNSVKVYLTGNIVSETERDRMKNPKELQENGELKKTASLKKEKKEKITKIIKKFHHGTRNAKKLKREEKEKLQFVISQKNELFGYLKLGDANDVLKLIEYVNRRNEEE